MILLNVLAAVVHLPQSTQIEQLHFHLEAVYQSYQCDEISNEAYAGSIIGLSGYPLFLLSHPDPEIARLYVMLLREGLRLGYLSSSHIDIAFSWVSPFGLDVLQELVKCGSDTGFIDALSFVNEAVETGGMSRDIYLNLILSERCPEQNLFHQFASCHTPNAEANFQLYCRTLEHLYTRGDQSPIKHVWLLKQEDASGLTAIHQMVNAECSGIAHQFLTHFEKSRAWLPLYTQQHLLNLRLGNDPNLIPQRHYSRHDSGRVMHRLERLRIAVDKALGERAAVSLIVDMDGVHLAKLISNKGFFATLDDALHAHELPFKPDDRAIKSCLLSYSC
ncbi:MAG: hypothetical protein P1U32_04795 [Legionellaceae bacterium]|nr:hypothetical protein [Legionellaceae bacterium]